MKRIKKILRLGVIVGVLIVVSGCQNVGEWLASRQNNNPTPTEISTNEQVNVTQESAENPPKAEGETKYNNIFFLSKKYDPETQNCDWVYWVHIPGNSTLEPIQRNIQLLLAGPTDRWQQAGYFSIIPKEVQLVSATIKNNAAYLEFSPELNNLAGSCAVLAARSQITATTKAAAKEHLGVELEQVVITTTGGDPATTLQP